MDIIKQKDIIDYCNTLGLDTIGFAKCNRFTCIEEIFDGAKTIISIAFPYLHNKNDENQIYFSKYTHGMDYHKVVRHYLSKICSFIESLSGKSAAYVDNNALPERYIAELCGVGFIGKNQMLITEKYGSYVFLGEIITDLELEESVSLKQNCGNCKACLLACPTRAINENRCNFDICLSHITQKKHIEDEWLLKFNGRLFGCDSCQKICPKNNNVEYSKIPEFKPFDFMENADVKEILSMSKKEFNERYGKTSCGWRGKNVLQRNALINAFLCNTMINIDFQDKNPYIKEYYNRLFNLKKL